MKEYFSSISKLRFGYFPILLLVLLLVSCYSDEGVASIDDDDPISVPIDDPEETITETLPLMSISTNGVDIPNEPKIAAEMTLAVDDEIVFSGNIAIELRGSSSLGFPKKGYGFETRNAQDMDMDVSFLGLPEEEDWVLHGPYSDKSLMRNVLIYDLSRQMNRYASRTRFVEMNINGTYNGVFVLMEKLKRDKGRLDIARLEPNENSGDDLTGGYLIKVDRSPEGDYTPQNSFVSQFGSELDATSATVHYVYDYPDPDEITQEQRNYISGYVNDFETALASDKFTDPMEGYAPYIDVDSFVDFIILNEITNNVDGYRLSTFMHKDRGGKLTMGPIWDFNLGFGNADYCAGNETNVWAFEFNNRCKGDSQQVAFWWERLMEDPAFVARFQARWSELRGSVLSEGNIFSEVDHYVAALVRTGSIDRNFQTWPVLGTYIWPNNFVGQTYDQEIDYMKSWISERLLWMDNAIPTLL